MRQLGEKKQQEFIRTQVNQVLLGWGLGKNAVKHLENRLLLYASLNKEAITLKNL